MMKMKRKSPDCRDDAAGCPRGVDMRGRAAAVIDVDVSGRNLSSAATFIDDCNEYFRDQLLPRNVDDPVEIESLDASRCRLGPEGTSRLLYFLSDRESSHPPPMRLRLRRNALGSAGGRALGAFLSTCPGVDSIDVGLNDMRAGGGEPSAAEAISDALKRRECTLKTLVMDKCALGPDGARHLAESLAVNASIETLDLAGNMIGPTGGEQLFRALRSNSTLVRLDLRMNRIGGGGSDEKLDVRALAEALDGGCSRLARLDLSYNDLRCSGCAVLSDAMRTSQCPLEELVLEKNDVKEVGVKAVADALGANIRCALRNLVIKGNAIGDGGAIALGKMLKNNNSLRNLDLSSCSIGNEGGASIGRGLARNSMLESLDLSKNSLGGGSDMSIFSFGVSKNRTLKSLRLSGNGFGETWGKSIAEALMSNHSLQHLDLSNNALSDPSIIDAVASSSSSIINFDFSDNALENISIETQLLLERRLELEGMELDLSLNPLSSPPLGRLADHSNLWDYLSLLVSEKTAITRIRLMVLGFGGVGKSTFCRAITNGGDAGEFRRSLLPVSEWGVDGLVDWAARLGTPWSKDAVRLIADEDIMGKDLTKLINDKGDEDDNENYDSHPSQVLLDLCSSKYPSIDADAFTRAISALTAKGYLSTVGAVKVEGTIDLGERTCSLVDFAGQVEFLVSHQLLLSSMHTICVIVQPAPSFGKPDHRHFGSWDYWSKFLSSLGDRRHGSLLLAVSQLDKLKEDGNENGKNQINIHIEREFEHIKKRALGAISCTSPLELDYRSDIMTGTIMSVKRTLSKSLDEVAHSWWVPASYELFANILQCAAKRKSSNHELPILTRNELVREVDAFCEQNPDGSFLLGKMTTDRQLLQRAINYLEAVGDVMQAGDEWLLIDPIGWFSTFLAHFIKDDLAVSTIQVDSSNLQRGTVNLKDIVQALKHEYNSPQQQVSQIMALLCGLELCVPLNTNERNNSPVTYLFPCLLPPLMSQSELASCGAMTSDYLSGVSAVRGHRFRESSGFIPPGLFVGILARMYRQLEQNIMHPARMWKDHAVLVLNNKVTLLIIRCDLDKATVDVIACAPENEQLFVGAAKGQASVVIWLVHLIKMFLRSYSQLNFEESWLCPDPRCHSIDNCSNALLEYKGSEFMLCPTKHQKETHDCNVEGCWRFLGTGHSLELMDLRKGQNNVCQSCNKYPVFRLRETIA